MIIDQKNIFVERKSLFIKGNSNKSINTQSHFLHFSPSGSGTIQLPPPFEVEEVNWWGGGPTATRPPLPEQFSTSFFEIPIDINVEMLPSCRMVVYYVREEEVNIYIFEMVPQKTSSPLNDCPQMDFVILCGFFPAIN